MGEPAEPRVAVLGVLIGTGSFGKVYRTSDHHATKILSKKNLLQSIVEGIETEIRLLSKLSHPNIIKMVANESTPDAYRIVMELCGPDAYTRCVYAPMTLQEVKQIASDTAKALAYLHGSRIIHRDVKPQNILTHAEGAKLCDFGLAVEGRLAFGEMGSPNYMAPEVIMGQAFYSYSVDLWSLGCTIYSLLNRGHGPFESTVSKEETYGWICMGRYHRPLPAGAETMIESLLQVSPSNRAKTDLVIDWARIDSSI